ncbi:hypothetical protein C3L33_00925, partial [Rhododendron williamsianum]
MFASVDIGNLILMLFLHSHVHSCLHCAGMDGLYYPPRLLGIFSSLKGKELCDAKDAEVNRKALENQIAELVSQTNIEEQDCQAELNACSGDLERKAFLMGAIMKESIELQDLAKYPY